MPRSPSVAAHGKDHVLKAAWRKSYAGLTMVVVFSVFINLLRLALPLYVLQVLDRVVSSHSHETLIMLTTITLAALLTAALLEVVRRRMFMHWGGWIERRFGPWLFEAGLDKSSEAPASSTLLRDLGAMRSFVAGSGVIAWLDVIWVPVFVLVVFLVSPVLAVILLCAVLAALTLGFLNELMTRETRTAAYRARSDDRQWVASAERNRETVGSLSMAVNLAGLWSRSAFERLDEGMRTQTINIYFAGAMRFVRQCLRIGILAVGIWLYINETLTLGSVIAAGILSRTAYGPLEKAMLRWREMLQARAAYGRMKNALRKIHTPQVSMLDNDLPVPLVVDDVTYRYPRQATMIFRSISVTLEPGQMLCVVGPSAVGKTTFSRLVTGLLSPRSGQVRLGDVNVYRLSHSDGPSRIGYLPQDIRLFKGTIRDNISRMEQGHLEAVVHAAKLVGIHEAILRLPAGYDTEISEDESPLSAGQTKALAIARAFYGCPAVVVMDEPEPHLDRTARRALTGAIETLKAQGVIVIVTTQSKTLSRIADKVLIFERTRCKVLDTREEIDNFRGRNRGKSRGSVVPADEVGERRRRKRVQNASP